MAQFYTKTHIDQIATVIGSELKQVRAERPTPSTSYTSFIEALEAAIGNGSMTIQCVPVDSAWSNPISLDMITPMSTSGGIEVVLGQADFNVGSPIEIGYWMSMEGVTSIMQFLSKLSYTVGNVRAYRLQSEDLGDGFARFRILASTRNESGNYEGTESTTYFARKTDTYPALYNYSEANIGNNAEVIVDLAHAFDSDIMVVGCENTSQGTPIEMS